MRSRLRLGAGCLRSRPIAAAAAIGVRVAVAAAIWVTVAVAAAISVMIAASPAFALDPDQPFSSYLRTHFTADDGLFAGVVSNVQQTPDGFLWLFVNGFALARFDGRDFDLVADKVTALAAAPNGDLWIGTADGLKRIPFDTLRHFDMAAAISYGPDPDSSSHITALRFDRNGVLWVGTEAGLFRFDDGRFTPVGPRVSIHEIEQAANGHLLLVTADGFKELDGSLVVPLPGLEAQLGTGIDEVFHVMEDRRGDVWYCTAKGVVRRSGTRWQRLSTYGSEGHGAFRTYEDTQGNIWVVKTEGLFRATADGLELAVPRMQVRSLYGDDDGNLWVGTNGDGLYRYQDSKARVFTTADGLPNDVIMTVLAASDGSLWAGANCGGLVHFDGPHIRTYDEKDGLLNSCVWALAEDANQDLWIGTWGGGAFRLHDGRFTQHLAGETVTGIVAARDGSLWFGTQSGLTRLQNGQLRTYSAADGLAFNAKSKVYEDRSGRILAGTTAGIDVLVGSRFESLSPVPRGNALPIGEDRSGDLFIHPVSQPFTFRVKGSRVETEPELCAMNSLVQTASGELWIGGLGIHRVPPDGLVRSRPIDEPLDHEMFGPQDGMQTTEVSGGSPNIALAGDGKVWIATPLGLAMFDPRRFPSTSHPATIYVRSVMVGRETRIAPRELTLPPGTSHVEIFFAAIETSSPEKIRMQYRLDGVDSQWLDAGPVPHAVYSNIPAGRHVLRMRACNRHGIWDRAGTTYRVTQEPHFYQTRWFLAATLVGALLVIGGAYRLRVRQISQQLSARFDERLAERTRVARELHDTFLQTVQGSKLVADHALKNPEDHERVLGAVKQLAGWLDRAIEEGRAALNSLRTSAAETDDLADALRRAIAECRPETLLDATVMGDAGKLHPIVRNEVHRIGSEAIRNSCTHSGADTLRVTLEHAHDFTLRVRDNGVGMAPSVSERGKEGHFGLSGMRERVERIGGKLTIDSAPGSGTSITVVVPGRLAYRARDPVD